MLRNFFSAPNLLGRLLVILLFAGGFVFAGVFNGFVGQTDAKSWCGGADAVNSSGSNNACDCLGSGCGSTSCSSCETVASCDSDCAVGDPPLKCDTCSAHCKNQNSDSTMCGDGSGCSRSQ